MTSTRTDLPRYLRKTIPSGLGSSLEKPRHCAQAALGFTSLGQGEGGADLAELLLRHHDGPQVPPLQPLPPHQLLQLLQLLLQLLLPLPTPLPPGPGVQALLVQEAVPGPQPHHLPQGLLLLAGHLGQVEARDVQHLGQHRLVDMSGGGDG